MKKILLAAGLLTGFGGLICARRHRFRLESPQLTGPVVPRAHVFNASGCDGDNVSPELIWHNPPVGTKSFAVTVYDPDAPTGSGWWHWVVFNIPANVDSLSLNAGQEGGAGLPRGAVQSLNDYGFKGYGGPCPPEGDRPHRYIFTVYALSVPKIDLDDTSMPASVGFCIQANKLAEAKITKKYGRAR